MRKYQTFPYTNGLCLSCCLQSVLGRRNIPPPNLEEISGYFEKRDKGLVVEQASLNRFLQKYMLKAEHQTAKGVIEPDLILRNAFQQDTDVLTAYSYDVLFKKRKSSLHISLLTDFNEGIEKEVLLFDSGFPESFLKRVSLPDLVNSILATESANSGFYLISS